MNKNEISIRYLDGLVLDNREYLRGMPNTSMAASFAGAIATYGYIPSEKLMNAISYSTEDNARKLYLDVISILKNLTGSHVKLNPMYRNFPNEVFEKTEGELYFNAVIHYLSLGEWMPESIEEKRLPFKEKVNYKVLDVFDYSALEQLFENLVTSNNSISETDKEVIAWFIDEGFGLDDIKGEVTFKETLCFIAGIIMDKGEDISSLVKTSTDVLRIATALSDGDISLSTNTKFKNLPRFQRKILVKALEGVINEEDISRHANKWVKLAHNLHVGDYSKEVYNVIKKVRENEKIRTFNSRVEKFLSAGNINSAVAELIGRPSEFARRLDHIIRLSSVKNQMKVCMYFNDVVDEVPTRILMQLYGNLKIRDKTTAEKIVFPKGSVAKAQVIYKTVNAMDVSIRNYLMIAISDSLKARFASLEPLGAVYVDTALKGAPLPSGMRSASKSAFQVARGTRFTFNEDEKNTLRFFIYWKGRDIDLSATFHDENYNYVKDVAYYNLKAGKCTHSGDITNAPNGAAEYIDIDIDYALSKGYRYVAMDVRVYSGPTFADHEECFAGWMMRSKPSSGEIFEPKTVENKIDLTSDSMHSIPVMFDLKTGEAIWMDLSTKSGFRNNQHSYARGNSATQVQLVKSLVEINNKPTIYDLLTMHVQARGNIVDNIEDADVVFDIKTAFKTEVINSKYLV